LKLSLPKIYAITDRELSGLSHTEQVRQFVAGGATLIQIRDKHASSRELHADALTAVDVAHNSGAKVLVNDRVDIALMTGADGVHLGQDDIPVAAARRLLGEKALIGISTHSVEQARSAAAEDLADYLAIGPIFSTATKGDHEPVVGPAVLTEVREVIGELPLVAIGGITIENLSDVLRAGADSAAMISEFYQAGKAISEQFKQLNAAAEAVNIVDTY
jgi:thiamine-phosphate pyrophosphorylase